LCQKTALSGAWLNVELFAQEISRFLVPLFLRDLVKREYSLSRVDIVEAVVLKL